MGCSICWSFTQARQNHGGLKRKQAGTTKFARFEVQPAKEKWWKQTIQAHGKTIQHKLAMHWYCNGQLQADLVHSGHGRGSPNLFDRLDDPAGIFDKKKGTVPLIVVCRVWEALNMRVGWQCNDSFFELDDVSAKRSMAVQKMSYPLFKKLARAHAEKCKSAGRNAFGRAIACSMVGDGKSKWEILDWLVVDEDLQMFEGSFGIVEFKAPKGDHALEDSCETQKADELAEGAMRCIKKHRVGRCSEYNSPGILDDMRYNKCVSSTVHQAYDGASDIQKAGEILAAKHLPNCRDRSRDDAHFCSGSSGRAIESR